MTYYQVAVMFEQAGNVRRLLEYAGLEPTLEDDLYIHWLRTMMDDLRMMEAFQP